MRIFKRFLVLCTFLLFFVVPTTVLAQSVEEIRNFESSINVNTDTTTEVTEKITYYFPTSRHGIYWTIPYEYSVKALRRPTLIDIKSVEYYPTSNPANVTRGQYTDSRSSGWLELQIGEEDTLIQGEYVFEIEYVMTYTGISYFDESEEVYLNAIGPGWEVPIRSASVTVKVPGEVTDSICYTGTDGSTDSDCTVDVNGNTVHISTTDTLQPFEGLTFALAFPVGTFEDTTRRQIIEALIANIGILLPIPVGIFLFSFIKRKGKNKKLTIVPSFTPEKEWNPLRSGYIYNISKNNKYVTALLIDLAVRGYIKINQKEKKKYELIKTEKEPSDLPDYVKTIYDGIFEKGDSVEVSKLSNTFYSKVQSAFLRLHNYLKETDLLSKRREKMRGILVLLGIVLIFISIFLLGFFIRWAALGWFLGLLISAIMIFASAFFVDLKSDLGNREYHDLLGLRLYIDTAEKRRIEFHNDPKKYNRVFETLLPYAMIFGLENKWAKEFEEIYTQQPDWYQGDFRTFNSYYLSRSLLLFNTSVAAKAVASQSYGSKGGYRSGGWSSGGSGFGGGGFSGGGGGGSGGGSW